MNRLSVLLLIAALVSGFGLTSCSGSDKQSKDPSPPTASMTTSKASTEAENDEAEDEEVDETDPGNNGEARDLDLVTFREMAKREGMSRPMIIDFSASWCGPCKAMAPTVKKIARKYAGQIDVYKVDIDEEEELAQIYDISSVPTLIFMAPGADEPVRIEGAIDQSEFESIISENFEL